MSDEFEQRPQDERVGKALVRANLGGLRPQLDAAFAPLGFMAEKGMGSIKYTGEVNGQSGNTRTVTATVAMRTRRKYVTDDISYRRYAGLVMDLTTDLTIPTRLNVAPKPKTAVWLARRLHGLYGRQPVPDLEIVYDDFQAWATDPDWAYGFLSDSEMRTLLRTLLNGPVLTQPGTLVLGPVRLTATLSIAPAELTQKRLAHMLTALVETADLAAKNPPLETASPNWLERQNPRTAAFIVAFGFLLGIPALLFACCMLPALLLLILNGL